MCGLKVAQGDSANPENQRARIENGHLKAALDDLLAAADAGNVDRVREVAAHVRTPKARREWA